jgi:hypothetical protein
MDITGSMTNMTNMANMVIIMNLIILTLTLTLLTTHPIHLMILTTLTLTRPHRPTIPLIDGSVPKKRKISSSLSQTMTLSERKYCLMLKIRADNQGTPGNILLPPTLPVLDSITLPLFKSNRNGKGILVYLLLVLMRISMKPDLPSHKRGYTMGWINWVFGSIRYVSSSLSAE